MIRDCGGLGCFGGFATPAGRLHHCAHVFGPGSHFQQPRFEPVEGTAKAVLMAVEVDQDLGQEQAFDGEGFVALRAKIRCLLLEGVVLGCADAFDFGADQLSFMGGDAAQSPGAVDKVEHEGDFFGVAGFEAVEGSGSEGLEVDGHFGGKERGFRRESMGDGVEGADGFACFGAGSGSESW